MHMARLADPSSGRGEYSLQSLSIRYEEDIVKLKEEMIENMLKDTTAEKEGSNYEAKVQNLLNYK